MYNLEVEQYQAHDVFLLVDCGTLTRPANGHVSHTAGTTFGQTATYICDRGYNLVGDSTRTCQATGVWSGSEPTCERMLLPTCMCACAHVCEHWGLSTWKSNGG